MRTRSGTLRNLTMILLLAALALTTAVTPQTASAQSAAIILSLPGTYEDFITDEVLAAFEAQYNVRVHIEYSAGFRMGPGGQQAVDSTLEDAAELAASADVIYVDQTTLTPFATQAGYFLNLAPLTSSDSTLNINDFYPAIWKSFQWDQGIWALPTAADVYLVTYDPASFDAAGLAYPTDRWTIDDFARAARALTTFNADGTVLTPGLTAGTPASTLPYLLVALTGHGFYDETVVPNQPSFNADLEYILDIWAELEAEGVVTTSFFRGGEGAEASPLRIEGTLGFSGRFADDENANQRQATMLPGGTAGLSASGFAVSSGTFYPEISYALASYLTTLPELASANFTSASVARQSLAGVEPATSQNGNGGGPGGGGARNFLSIPDQIQAVVDQALYSAMSGAEVRYSSYVTSVVTQINSGAGDALSLLQEAEASAISDVQTAAAAASSTNVIVATAPQEVVLAAGEITLNCAINTGFGGGPGRGGDLTNEDAWNAVIADYVASNALVGAVNLVPVSDSDLATLAESYDCFILPSNAVQGSDVSPLLNLDPLLDTDPSFNRNDILPGVLTQVQQNAQTWAMPLAIQPAMISYNPALLAQAGVPEPVNGWTTDAFIDALAQLDQILDDETAPFTPNDPSGSYLLQLVGAFGGVPIDYRTDPPTLNFTDPNAINAIQQVLDLVGKGYIEYTGVANVMGGGMRMGQSGTTAISTDTMASLMRGFGRGGNQRDVMLQTLYPQGSSGGFVAFDITTGYISSAAQSPEAAYAFLSTAAAHPELFTGMPVRSSQVGDPAVVAAQGEDVATVYAQLNSLLQNPNTIVFPANSGLGGIASNFLTEYWLKAAFDAYVLEGADLVTELQDAQVTTQAYLDCIAVYEPDTTTNDDPMMGNFMAMGECANAVDPELNFGMN